MGTAGNQRDPAFGDGNQAGAGQLEFSKEDMEQRIADLRLRVLPYTSEHSYKLFGLPLHHTDPFDRQIIAQAMAEYIPVMTSDRIFGAYQGLRINW